MGHRLKHSAKKVFPIFISFLRILMECHIIHTPLHHLHSVENQIKREKMLRVFLLRRWQVEFYISADVFGNNPCFGHRYYGIHSVGERVKTGWYVHIIVSPYRLFLGIGCGDSIFRIHWAINRCIPLLAVKNQGFGLHIFLGLVNTFK